MTLVNSSHDSATFAWPSLPPNSLTYVIGLVIQYRETTSRYWKQSMTLHPATTRHTVTSLSASRQYKARLVALTNSTSAPRVSLSVVQFTTRSHEGKCHVMSCHAMSSVVQFITRSHEGECHVMSCNAIRSAVHHEEPRG